MRHVWKASSLIACVALVSAQSQAEPQPAVQKGVPTPSPVVIAGKPLPPDQPIAPLVWHGQRFSALDYTLTGLGGAITLAASIVKPRTQHSLSGGLWFDEGVRDLLRADGLQRRYVFRDASDVGLSLAVTWPFFADALTTAWWYRGSRDVAEEMALIDLETLAISGGVQGITNVLVSRERPYGRNCGSSSLPSDAVDCEGNVHYRSFFSGHSAFSFTGAALICVHHFENDLLGSPWDGLSCAGGYLVAATTATFRVVSDVHYASDVLTGALVGTLVGYGVPLLHYRRPDPYSASTGGLRLSLVPAAGGVGVLGIF
jgi:membrane-associated phospholipid phosphatase